MTVRSMRRSSPRENTLTLRPFSLRIVFDELSSLEVVADAYLFAIHGSGKHRVAA
jgi:fermentation-respiration switch protein FrsA (DUF1100 family)